MGINKESRTATKTKLLAAAIIVIIVSSAAVALFVQTLGNEAKPDGTIRIACVGDSITEGTEYPNDLWMMLGANYTVKNFGVGGSTTLLSSSKPFMNQLAFVKAKESLPNIVVIMLGTNDAAPVNYQNISNFVDDYKKLAGEFEALTTKPQIYLVKPPPIFNNSSGPNSANLVEGIIPHVEQAASELGLPLVDIYSVMVNHPEYFRSDGVHPNDLGASVIASEVYKAINSTTSG